MRAMPRGVVVGVYFGELITRSEHRERIAAGCNMRYVLCLLDHTDAELMDEFAMTWPGMGCYIDSFDESLSSWCRFINHAAENSSACNLSVRADAFASLAWFEASRDIAAGEELCFDYGPEYARDFGLD